MRENFDEPVRLKQIAQRLKINQHKLERLFLAELEAGPQKVYLRMCLLAARRLVM